MARTSHRRVEMVVVCALLVFMAMGCGTAPPPDEIAPPPADTTPPVISDMSIDVTGTTTAALTFTTDEPVTCRVEYGTSEAFGLSTSTEGFSTSHSLDLSQLGAGQEYCVRIQVQDQAGNVTTSSIFTFETPKPSPPRPAGTLAVYFIDVGQGDAILIDYGDQELLIDGGQNTDCLSCLLEHVDGPLEVMVATHMHADHIGGLPDVLEQFDVESVWVNGETAKSNIYKTFIADVASEGADVHTARRGGTIALGDLTFEILHPTDALTDDPNLNSVVLSLTFGEIDFLFTGDAETPVEQELVSLGLVHDIEFLKVGHHCSRTSSSESFLACIQPEIAIYSAGVDNRYGHPHTEALERLAACGAYVFGTDVNGTMVVRTDGKDHSVEFEHTNLIPDVTDDDKGQDEVPDEEPAPIDEPEMSSDVRISTIYYMPILLTHKDEISCVREYTTGLLVEVYPHSLSPTHFDSPPILQDGN